MKALTLWQPWATLVAIGAKTIETRSWHTNYRGTLAIHAGKATSELYLAGEWPAAKYLWRFGFRRLQFPVGEVIATCNLVDVFEFTEENWKSTSLANRHLGDCSPGRYGWRLKDIVELDKPIAATGKQRLWEWTPT